MAMTKKKRAQDGVSGVNKPLVNFSEDYIRPDYIDWDDYQSNNPYRDLGNAIIAQAYKDYINVEFASYSFLVTKDHKVIDSRHNLKDLSINKDEILRFFNSELYSLITDVDPGAMVKLLKEEIGVINKALDDGMIWDMFVINNYGSRYSVDKNDYLRIYRNRREKAAILSKIRKYESNFRPDPKETRAYYIKKKKLPKNPMHTHDIYILLGDKLNFYAWDANMNDYYKVFDGSKILKRKSYYKKSKYYNWVKNEKGV